MDSRAQVQLQLKKLEKALDACGEDLPEEHWDANDQAHRFHRMTPGHLHRVAAKNQTKYGKLDGHMFVNNVMGWAACNYQLLQNQQIQLQKGRRLHDAEAPVAMDELLLALERVVEMREHLNTAWADKMNVLAEQTGKMPALSTAQWVEFKRVAKETGYPAEKNVERMSKSYAELKLDLEGEDLLAWMVRSFRAAATERDAKKAEQAEDGHR